MTARLMGTAAIVTGGARGIGAATVFALAVEGAHVFVADTLIDEGRSVAADVGGTFVPIDVGSEADWKRLVGEVKKLGLPLRTVVNNAGILRAGPIEQQELSEFLNVLDVNVVGVMLGVKHTAPLLREAGGGTIVNLSSTAGLIGYGGLGAYVASKWAVRGFTKVAALELAPDIRVVSVHPGPIATPMTAGIGDELVQAQPLPRFGKPEEVAAMIQFLATRATFSTGTEFVVDGGAITGSLTVEL